MHARAQRRHGGRWKKEELEQEPARGPAGPSSFAGPAEAAAQKGASPDKRLFMTEPSSHTFSLEANSAL
jgi:hypothetical protein